MELKKYFTGDYYVLCLCEGTAEKEIIEWLLEENKLLFSYDDLINGDKQNGIVKVRSVKNVEKRYLSLDYDRKVVILRILDSRSEQFKLGKLYKDRFDVKSFLTPPEIEILMIIKMNDYGKYKQKHPNLKPSEYATKYYKIPNIKKSGVMRDFFENDIEQLIEAITTHKSKHAKNELTICNLLNI